MRRIVVVGAPGLGNRETFRNAVFARDSLLRFTWTEHPKYPARYRGLMHDPEWSYAEWVHLRSPREVRRRLARLR